MSSYSPDYFAQLELTHYLIYADLASREVDASFKETLLMMAAHEKGDHAIWAHIAGKKEYTTPRFELLRMRLARGLFGLTFVARLLERAEHQALKKYRAYYEIADAATKEKLPGIIAHEDAIEHALIDQIKEEKVEFISSVILGLNDGLIELTGALTGFSFAFVSTRLVAMSGLITGIVASLSMASSAYISARHETNGKDPIKSGLYTGVTYGAVVAVLVVPFLIFSTTQLALIIMFCIVLLIIAGTSAYTAVIFNRNFKKQFAEMLFFSVGVALIAFVIGSAFKQISGVTV